MLLASFEIVYFTLSDLSLPMLMMMLPMIDGQLYLDNYFENHPLPVDYELSAKPFLLNICIIKERLSLNIFVCVCCSVLPYSVVTLAYM